MSALSLRLPESLHRTIRDLARRDDVSINQFIATAVAEKTAALLAAEYLETRGSRADRRLFDRILDRVPDAPPVSGDERPGSPAQRNRAVSHVRRKRTPRRRSHASGA